MPVRTKDQLKAELNTTFFENPGGGITPALVQTFMIDIIDSIPDAAAPNMAFGAGAATGVGSASASALALFRAAGTAAGSSSAAGTSAASMPSGALGVWYADAYNSGASAVPNDAVPITPTSSGAADGNIYLSGSTVSGGIIDFGSSGAGLLKFPSAVSLASATVLFTTRFVATNNNWHMIVSDHADFHSWSVGDKANAAAPGFYIDSTMITDQQAGDLLDRISSGWHISSFSYDASTHDMWVDGVLLRSNAASIASHSIQTFDICQIIGAFTAGYNLNSLVIFNRKLSSSEQKAAYSVLKARAALSSITIPTTSPEKIYYAFGDSIAAGTAGSSSDPGYAYLAARTASPLIRGADFGIGSANVATVDTAITAGLGAVVTAAVATAGKDVICSIGLGTNDLGSGNSATFLTDFAAICDRIRGFGVKLIVGTILPRSSNAQFNIDRAAANATIRTWVGTHADAIMDFASDATMGPDAAASDTTYYADGVHPTSAGHALMAPYLVTAINSL